MEEDEIRLEPEDYEDFKVDPEDEDYFGEWHDVKQISFRSVTLKIAGMITGCGIAQMYGAVSLCLDKEITEAELREYFADLVDDGIGALVCTLGQTYYKNGIIDYEGRLLALGFKKLAQYSNYRHATNGKAKQRLYIIKL